MRDGPEHAYQGVEAPSKVRAGQAHPRAEPGDPRGPRRPRAPPPSFSFFLRGNLGAEQRPKLFPRLSSSAPAMPPAFGSHGVCARPSGCPGLGRAT